MLREISAAIKISWKLCHGQTFTLELRARYFCYAQTKLNKILVQRSEIQTFFTTIVYNRQIDSDEEM